MLLVQLKLKHQPNMADWMEIIGITSALVGLLIAIPAIYHTFKGLYSRVHDVGPYSDVRLARGER